MKETTLKTTKRKAIPYIINLKCECGGKFVKDDPLVFDIATTTIKHTCDKCGRSINSKEIYPNTMVETNEPEEDHSEVVVYEDITNVIGL